jgi:single-strand DNA-binding protein
MNHITLIGRLGKDPVVRFTQGGQPVANFSMATTSVYKDKAGVKQESTQWHRITVWGKLAEHVGQFLKKGRLVCVVGRLEYSSYTDKDKIERYTSTIAANSVEFLDSAKGKQIEAPASTVEKPDVSEESSSQQVEQIPEDDIPF